MRSTCLLLFSASVLVASEPLARPDSIVTLTPTAAEGVKQARGGLSVNPTDGVGAIRFSPAAWDLSALRTHGYRNHAARSVRGRDIRYENGEEELHDEIKDPYEWTDLAADTAHDPVTAELSRVFPKPTRVLSERCRFAGVSRRHR